MDMEKTNRNEERERIRKRLRSGCTKGESPFDFLAAEEASPDDEDIVKRVCVYCRVPADDPVQITSHELTKKLYAEWINYTPGWNFAGIYVDEGIASPDHQKEFERMIGDCCAGKIDIIVTKSVFRFAQNADDCLSIIRKLARLDPPVGVLFEKERLFTLGKDVF